jgi:hypothetical protein
MAMKMPRLRARTSSFSLRISAALMWVRPRFSDFAAFDAQRFVQRDGLEVFDRHFAGESDDVMELVDLAHGVVEDAGDDAAVAVAGRSGVALAEAEAADEGLAGFVEDEFEAHAVGVVHAADEAVVLLQLHEAGVVAVGLGWHGGI